MKTRRLPLALLIHLIFAALLAVPSLTSAQITAINRPEFAYAVNENSNDISAFKVSTNGLLTPLSTPSFPAGSSPTGVAVDPTGRFIYTANILTDNVSAYSIGPKGLLTPVPGSPFAAGSGPAWVTVDPTGRFVYVANCADLCSGSGQGNISGYAINQPTGALTPVPGSPFTADEIPYAIVVDPTGSFEYVANFRSGTLSVFKIDQCSGALWTSIQNIPIGSLPISLTLDPHGRFLYVVNTGSDNVYAFAVGSNAVLTPVPGSPFTTADSTQGIAIDPYGEFAYITAGNSLLGFSIGAHGELTPLAGSPFASPGFLLSLQLDHSGRFLYGAATFTGVAAWALNPITGKVTPVPGAPFPAGANTFFVTTTMGR